VTCLRLIPRACGFIAREIDGHALLCLEMRGGGQLIGDLLRCLPRADTSSATTELLGGLSKVCGCAQGSEVIGGLLRRGSRKDSEQMYEILQESLESLDEESQTVIQQQLTINLP